MTGNFLAVAIFVQDLRKLDEIVNRIGMLLRNSEGKMREGIGKKIVALNEEVVSLARRLGAIEKSNDGNKTPDIRNANLEYTPRCLESKLIFDILLSIDAYRDEIDKAGKRGKTQKLKKIIEEVVDIKDELAEVLGRYGSKEQ